MQIPVDHTKFNSLQKKNTFHHDKNNFQLFHRFLPFDFPLKYAANSRKYFHFNFPEDTREPKDTSNAPRCMCARTYVCALPRKVSQARTVPVPAVQNPNLTYVPDSTVFGGVDSSFFFLSLPVGENNTRNNNNNK